MIIGLIMSKKLDLTLLGLSSDTTPRPDGTLDGLIPRTGLDSSLKLILMAVQCLLRSTRGSQRMNGVNLAD